jgi:hypothetical protein
MKKNLKELRALNKKYNISITIDKNMQDHSNDPFVLRKMEIAEKFIAEHGLPDSIDQPKALLKSKAQRPKPKTNTSSKPKF